MSNVDFKMSRRERLMRYKRTLVKPKRRKSTSNNYAMYSVDYKSLMSGEGGKGTFDLILEIKNYSTLYFHHHI